MVPIGKWVLRESCRQARSWMDNGLPVGTIAVNVSAVEFRNSGFLDDVFATLLDTGLPPGTLELELTESAIMKRVEVAEATLNALRAAGIRVAIDDFGTGYSSLSYLRRFPIDVLKIDQSFVRQISVVPYETSIVTAVISMGHGLKLKVVAEGVETEDELAFLRTQHCDEAQGFYFSRPLPPCHITQVLETGFPGISPQ